ncbi:ATP-binding protein [Lusitaniella coriacea]|uniref:ATP-binding protein n=1 Tax=Lusitaniella coriacea TaxID=1983105 RepID=UPI003CEC41CA
MSIHQQDKPETADRGSLFDRVTQRILQSPELPDALNATAAEVRSFLGTDRVKVYQFHPDGSGRVVAESICNDRLPSLAGLNFPADDIPPEARELFVKVQVRSIIDLSQQQIIQSFPTEPEENEEIRYRPVDSCHVEYLTAMGVQSSVVVPILDGEKLWGLLVSHNAVARPISADELQALQWVADQLAIAISANQLLRRARRQAYRETAINRISHLLHSLHAIELQKALEATIEALQGSGGRLYLASNTEDEPQLYRCGTQPTFSELAKFPFMEQYSVWQQHFQPGTTSPWAIADLYRVPQLRNLQPAFRPTKIRGILIIPLEYRQEFLGYLSVFRDEIDTEILWAGQVDSDRRQEQPRLSFEVWKESKKGQADSWREDEPELLQAIGEQFAGAIQQYRMHQQVQALNANLEEQVRERTANLQQALIDLKETQTQLIHTEKMSSLGQLIAGIAHEINNPINFIYGNLSYTRTYIDELLELIDLYQQHDTEPHDAIARKLEEIELEFLVEDLPKILASINVGTERIRQLVLSLKNFSRLDEAQRKPVDIHEGIESTLLILQHRLKPKSDSQGIEIIKEYGDLPPIECYAGQLNQVFMNVLSNAIDALETAPRQEHHQITIRTALSEEGDVPQAMISIADNGSGIPPAVQEKIFDPFFTTKPIGKGTGLGLSICHQIIVEKHGGQLKMISEPDRGTEVVIEIPVS